MGLLNGAARLKNRFDIDSFMAAIAWWESVADWTKPSTPTLLLMRMFRTSRVRGRTVVTTDVCNSPHPVLHLACNFLNSVKQLWNIFRVDSEFATMVMSSSSIEINDKDAGLEEIDELLLRYRIP